MKKLPDAEFDIMKAVWGSQPPVTSGMVLEKLDGERQWKVQTVVTLMQRLVERGFLDTAKNGKERLYTPRITKDEYVQFETDSFLRQVHNNSLLSLVSALQGGDALSEGDAQELRRWLEERRR